MEILISETIAFVKATLAEAEGGHDWFHIERVWKNTLLLLQDENADPLICQLAALLHDIADSKFNGGDEMIGPDMAAAFLEARGVDARIINEVKSIIKNMSYKASFTTPDYHSKELDVVQDADRLDAIGAIGIARAFNYGGFKNRKLYDPGYRPQLYPDKESYKNSNAPTINHFYEKLLLLKDKMNTTAARKIAVQRHRYMEDFLQQFFSEWNTEK